MAKKRKKSREYLVMWKSPSDGQEQMRTYTVRRDAVSAVKFLTSIGLKPTMWIRVDN